MAHIRSQIRDTVATALTSAGLTTKKSRAYAVGTFPMALVYAETENSDAPATSGGSMIRRLVVTVEYVAVGRSDTLDDTLDDAAVVIETALADTNLGGLVKNIHLQNTNITFDPSGDEIVGLIRMSFSATYGTTAIDPETTR